MSARSRTLLFATLAVVGAPGLARAQTPAPSFDYGKFEELKTVVWKASVQAGLILNTGNSNNLSFSAAANASRNDGKNKLTLDVGGSYARSTIYKVNDFNGNGMVDPGELSKLEQTTTALWNAKLRYDRYFTPNNSGYIDAFASGNEPAGMRVQTGGQIGYSRQVYKSDLHLLRAEVGLDYSYIHYVVAGTNDLNVASLRLFVGYVLSFTKDTSFNAGVEALFNLNPLTAPTGGHVDPFTYSRVNAKVALITKLYKNINFRLGFTAIFNNVVGPIPSQGGLPFAMGYKPLAEKLDTITDASLVISFL